MANVAPSQGARGLTLPTGQFRRVRAEVTAPAWDAGGVLATEALGRALEAQWAVVQQVRAESLMLETPCPGWSVSDVMNHSLGVTIKFADFASGTTDHPSTPPGDLLGGDHLGAFHSAMLRSQSAWESADLSMRCFLSFGVFPAEMAAAINLVDVLAHSWDIATSTASTLTCDDDLWVAALGASERIVGPRRDLRHYAPEKKAAASASALQRFLNFLGRDEAWPV